MTNIIRRHALQSMVALGAGAALPTARAQSTTYPNAPVRFVIPTTSGGGYDTMMRLIGAKLTEAWGQPVIVEPKPGASGAISARYVARSPADGYTLLLAYSGLLTTVVLQENPPYQLDELVPITMLVTSPITLGVRASLGVNTLQEFISLIKGQPPGKFSYGSYGQGSGGHFIGEQINLAAGSEVVHVPYKGEAPAIQALLGEQVDAVVCSIGAVSAHAGRIKALAVASPTRFPLYKDVPTFAEAGLPEVNLPGYGALLAPAGTPKPVIQKLATELNRVVMLPDIQSRLLNMGFEPVGWPPEQLERFLADQLDEIRKVVNSGRVRLES